MKKTFLLLLSVTFIVSADAQLLSLFKKKKSDTTQDSAQVVTPKAKKETKTAEQPKVVKVKEPTIKTDWKKVDLTKRPADHFMFQYGGDILTGNPDSIYTKGFSRHFNFYFMLDKPFKKDPHFSLGYGAGFGTTNLFFNHQYIKVGAAGSTLAFDTTTNYHKAKIVMDYFEIPVEIRYFSDPVHPGKSWKAALGIKAGLLLKSYFKGKDLLDQNGNTVYGPTYVYKESDTKFFNGFMITPNARFGYGNFSLHVDFQATSILKSTTGPTLNVLSIGLTVSGL